MECLYSVYRGLVYRDFNPVSPSFVPLWSPTDTRWWEGGMDVCVTPDDPPTTVP